MMLLKEILEILNAEDEAIRRNANDLSKEFPVGQRKFKKTLMEIGFFYQNKGEKGWYFEGNKEDLEKPFTDFIDVKGSVVKKVKTSNSDNNKNDKKGSVNISKSKSINASIESSVNEYKENSVNDNGVNSVNDNDILALIQGDDIESDRVYKGVYFDRDIANFLEKIKHGNRSEVLNKIVRAYLLEHDLL